MTDYTNEKVASPSGTHQADELSVQPAQNVRALLRLCPVDSQAGHEDGGGLLVKRCSDALDLSLSISPAEEEDKENTL